VLQELAVDLRLEADVRHPRVVHQDVDPSVAPPHVLDDVMDPIGVGQVGGQTDGIHPFGS
jgi:hypothetical protein